MWSVADKNLRPWVPLIGFRGSEVVVPRLGVAGIFGSFSKTEQFEIGVVFTHSVDQGNKKLDLVLRPSQTDWQRFPLWEDDRLMIKGCVFWKLAEQRLRQG